MVYAWDFMIDEVRTRAATMPIEGARAFLEVMAAAELNPWELGLAPDEKRTGNMPTVHFGPRGEGMVTYLIYEPDRQLLVTDVTWIG